MTDRELEWKEKSKEILLNTPIAKINSVESEVQTDKKESTLLLMQETGLKLFL